MSLINGLPAHVLLVHVVVVLVPLTAVALALAALWPRAARRLGPLLPLLALVALVSVPLTTEAGDWLEHHVERNALVHQHTELGDGLLPWVLGLFVLAVAVWWAGRGTQAEPGQDGGSFRFGMPVRVVLGLLSLVVAVGAVVDVYRIGDSGAKAAWHDGFSASATQPKGE
ncbi:DUF2231 domain-containing protein [Streptomyces sp. NPDC093707]|uniref:DUF2231 domain-containing protein n=1 Tax=Streptomyces sp. NPDC093707 TaxID=3154984 RepID=UPI003450F104